MLSRMWQSVQNWTGSINQSKKEPVPIVKRPLKTRFLIDNPEKWRLSVKQTKISTILDNSFPKNQEQLQTIYKIICEDEQQAIIQSQDQENEEFLQSLSSIGQAIQAINLNEMNIQSRAEPLARMEQIAKQLDRSNNCGKEQVQLYKLYKKQVLTVLQSKYVGQKPDYPEITFQQFKKIKGMWGFNGREVEKTVPGCLHLKIKDIQLLDNRKWLNDQIISEYVNLLKQKIENDQNISNQKSFRIVNSLQVTTFFEKKKYDEAKVLKFFARQKIDQNDTIVMAVHKVNHWIFIKLNSNSLSIYDSMYKPNAEEYLKFPTINNIFQFAESFYELAPKLISVKDFPQQFNDYDCGMMMLCGIKDVIKNSAKWNFRQEQMPYKRVLVAKQLIDHRLSGF